ncbi:hypothetical protein TWF481_005120 [Arthrobotrys musiformis]|uniref:Uncharacterized protein n=1 Tax=Arthrobotrys musiformis TaxID=47236 RepID=A0AAV9WE09_9PEZI
MKTLKPLTILTLLPTPLSSLVIPLSTPPPPPPPPSPTTNSHPTAPTPSSQPTPHQKRNGLSPSIIDAILHRARPPESIEPLVTAKPSLAAGVDVTPVNAGPRPPPEEVEEVEWKKNVIRL